MTSLSRHWLKCTVLRLCKALGLFRFARRFSRRKLLILCYHGFALSDEAAFRPRLFMDIDVFRDRLERVQRMGAPVLALEDATRRLRDGTLPNNAVCLTIDDGFHSVLTRAAAPLQERAMPATLYVTSYYVEKQAPIFRLVVQYMFWKTTVRTLETHDQSWGAHDPVALADHAAKDREMWRIIEVGERDFDEPGRQRISATLGKRLEVAYDTIADSRMFTLLSPNEIQRVQAMGIDIQLHTHRHRLSVDERKAVEREVIDNKNVLEPIVGKSLTHFCYPSGVWEPRQWQWLAELDVETATTCNPGLNTPDTPLLGLYRVVDANDIETIEFEAELYGFSELIRLITGRRKRHDAARQTEQPTAN